MILVTLGTQDIQFDRLLKEIDRLIEGKMIDEEVIVQSGYSSHSSGNYKSFSFLSFNEFDQLLKDCRFVITHGGTGTIVTALKNGKKVIAVARRQEYGEHVDDHQTELIKLFSERGFVLGIVELDDLEKAVLSIDLFRPEKFEGGNGRILRTLEEFINRLDLHSPSNTQINSNLPG